MTDGRQDLSRGESPLPTQLIASIFDELNQFLREWSETIRKALDFLHDTHQRAGDRRRSMKYQPPPRILTDNINPTGHPPHRAARSHYPRRHASGR